MLKERLSALLEPLIEGLGYELVLLELQSQGRGSLLRLYIDAPGGVDLGDCERVSREVSAALDVNDPFAGSYRLEISSPGLDRPLAKPEHFARYAGSLAKLQLLRPVNGRRRYVGRLQGLEAGQVLMEVEGEVLRFDQAEIEKARLVPELQG